MNKPKTVNAYKNANSNVVFKSFPKIDEEVKKIIDTAREICRERFVDMMDEEMEAFIEGHQEAFYKQGN